MTRPVAPALFHLVHRFAKTARFEDPHEEPQFGALKVPGEAQKGHRGGARLAQLFDCAGCRGRQRLAAQPLGGGQRGGDGLGYGVEQGGAVAVRGEMTSVNLYMRPDGYPIWAAPWSMALAIWLSAVLAAPT